MEHENCRSSLDRIAGGYLMNEQVIKWLVQRVVLLQSYIGFSSSWAQEMRDNGVLQIPYKSVLFLNLDRETKVFSFWFI